MARWMVLFDRGEIEQAVALLNGESAPAVLDTLREDAQEWLDAHPDTWDREAGRAARHLVQTVSTVARLIALGAEDRCTDRVHHAWLDFVAAAAGQRVYHDLPQEQARRSHGGKKGAKTKRKRAAEHWTNDCYRRALAFLRARGQRRIGRDSLNDRAWIIAGADGKTELECKDLTPYRAGKYLKRPPSE